MRPNHCLSFILASLATLGGGTLPAQGEVAPQEPQDPVLKLEVDPETGNITLAVDENQGVPITDFIKLAGKMTGKNYTFVPSELLTTQNNTIFWIEPITMKRQEFDSFFQTMLYIRGFATIPRGTGNTEVIQIVPLTGASAIKDLMTSARYVNLEDVEDYASQTGVVILTTMTLEFVNAQTASQSLRPFYAQGGAGAGHLTMAPINAQSMVLQGFGPQVYAAIQMLKLVDKPPEEPQIEVVIFPLEHASADEILQPLDDILKARSGPVAGTQQPIPGQEVELKIVQLPGQNALILSGSIGDVNRASNLIARMDLPPEATTSDIHVVPLKNVLAEELSRTLREFLQQDQQAERQVQQGQPGTTQVRQQRRVVIMDHPETNSLLISGSSTKFQQVRRLIEELDRRQPQVLIEAAVVELSTNALDRFGVELGLIDLVDSGANFTRPFGFTSGGLSTFTDTDDDGLPDTRLPDLDGLQGLTGGIISGGDFAIPLLINAIASDDRANILSLPSVLVNNNENATVSTSESRPTIENTQNASTSQSGVGSPRDAGITLQISPTISSNNYLRLNINLTVSRFQGAFDPSSPTGGGVTVSRQISTQVTMPSNDTMVIGGVIEDREGESHSGVPILKDIPILGWLFSSRSVETTKTNLYFFITPHILNEEDFLDLWELSNRQKMDAERYIGTQRMQLVDRKWKGGGSATLEDEESTPDDLDAHGNNEMPFYLRRNEGEEVHLQSKGLPGVRGSGPSTPSARGR